MKRVAAVDCGTNTIKLLIADLDADSCAEVELVRETRMVRLGQDVDRTGRLAEEAMARAFAAIEEYAAIVDRLGVSALRFCATSATRDSANATDFAAGVRDRLGVEPEVLSGGDEALLSFTGATRSMGPVDQPVVVLDIGGGSTEVVLGTPGRVDAAHSLDVGSVRLTERLVRSDPLSGPELTTLTAVVDDALDQLPLFDVRLETAATVIAVAGTGLTVAAAALGLESLDRRLVDRAVIPVGAVHGAVARLLAMSVAERKALPYMLPGRADVIGVGGVILSRVLRRTPVSHVRTSVADIVDGIAWSLA